MGGEFGQWREWAHDRSLDWHLLAYPLHEGLQRWVRDLNLLYGNQPALYEADFDPAGFEWIDCNDTEQSVLSFIRQGHSMGDIFLVVCNFTQVPRFNYRVGTPRGGFWRELLNSDAKEYGGGGQGNLGGVEASAIPFHRRSYSLKRTLPPLATLLFKSDGKQP